MENSPTSHFTIPSAQNVLQILSLPEFDRPSTRSILFKKAFTDRKKKRDAIAMPESIEKIIFMFKGTLLSITKHKVSFILVYSQNTLHVQFTNPSHYRTTQGHKSPILTTRR
jgi:hypothetical protein